MLTMAIWWLAILLEAVLLVRGLQEKLVRLFPIFYLYVFVVFLSELLRFSSYEWYPSHYSQVYWATQFPTLLAGSAVIFEVYRVGLRSFPGTTRMTRFILTIVFGIVFAKSLVNPSRELFFWLARTSEDLEKSLRIVQALAIVTLLAIFRWYAIPIGRNLKGILWGYGFYVAARGVELNLLRYYRDYKLFWPYIGPFFYLLGLSFTMWALWSLHPVPEASRAMQLENDYEALVSSTRSQFQRTLARLGWAARL